MSESNFLALESIERYSYGKKGQKKKKKKNTCRPKMTCNSYKWEMTNILLDNKKKNRKTIWGHHGSFFYKVALKKQNMLCFGYYVHCNVRR